MHKMNIVVIIFAIIFLALGITLIILGTLEKKWWDQVITKHTQIHFIKDHANVLSLSVGGVLIGLSLILILLETVPKKPNGKKYVSIKRRARKGSFGGKYYITRKKTKGGKHKQVRHYIKK